MSFAINNNLSLIRRASCEVPMGLPVAPQQDLAERVPVGFPVVQDPNGVPRGLPLLVPHVNVVLPVNVAQVMPVAPQHNQAIDRASLYPDPIIL